MISLSQIFLDIWVFESNAWFPSIIKLIVLGTYLIILIYLWCKIATVMEKKHWFEYKRVSPKGYIKLISQLSQMRDADIEIIMFTGNHDMWMFDYFEEELGIVTHHQPIVINKQGKKLMIGHGDGLGPGDINYKIIKKIFSNPICQWLFERIHPNTGLALMRYISGSSDREYGEENNFLGADKEWLVQYCEKHPKRDVIDFFIFGHRHLALDYTLSNGKSRYINTGDWLEFNSYAVLDAGEMSLQYYEQ